ncbi:50S ribosomal protein L24 [Candidatus Woesebacteria bacterium]|nr:50S ribosomal protein L24 [Candidatus Woesebacteria bacterium]MCD8507634.1 50S ribosomal protein L24 [Candidatus Woesebacteria bacterium]MCD8526780.1 50S ribosomal protein L24 [Candidatus Woesebacteria bacterium]MCD8546474.1 50S ribosomal protein L24 [Candidatus Woesebacteria bacterium]
MKFKVGDKVIVTSGKDKGHQGQILKVNPEAETVVVQGANMYTRNFKPMMGQAGRRERKERALPTAKVAIWNEATKQADRIGYQIEKDGTKVRVFKKTGKKIE